MQRKVESGQINPFPQTCPVQNIKVVCADYIVPTEAQNRAHCKSHGAGVLELTLNQTNPKNDIASTFLEDAILAETKELLQAVAPSRIHVEEVKAQHRYGSRAQIVRVHIRDDTQGWFVQKLRHFANSNALNPFPLEVPVEKAEVVCPRPE